MRRTPTLLVAAVVLAPPAALAQVEITAILGYRGGDSSSFLVEANTPRIACLVPPCVVAEAGTPESEVLGLVLDVQVARGWMVEALISRQDAELELRVPPAVSGVEVLPESFELTTLQIGLLRRWGGGGLEPFVAGGAGIARVESSGAVLTPPVLPGDSGRRLGSEEVLSASLGGGARLGLGPRLGLRLEGRAWWTDLPSGLGGALVQGELGVGLSFRPARPK
jgi:hypothetical protein